MFPSRICSVIKSTACFLLALKQHALVMLLGVTKRFCLTFPLRKILVYLTKNDEALTKENTKLFFIAKLRALQDQIRDVSLFTSLSDALLRSLRKPLAYHKQFWTRVNKAQKPCFICQQPIEQPPKKTSLETGTNLSFLLSLFSSKTLQSQDQVQ